jgi:hypothetical protein
MAGLQNKTGQKAEGRKGKGKKGLTILKNLQTNEFKFKLEFKQAKAICISMNATINPHD